LFAEDFDDNALKAKLPLLSSTSNNQIDITKSPTDKDAPVSIYTIECTGNVIGKVTDKPDEPNIRSGLGIIYMLSDSSYNYEFTYTYFEPGKNSISTNWKLNKINPYSDAKAVLFFIDSKGNSNIQNIKHVYQKLDIDKTKIDFGYVKQNEQKSSTITVVNKTDKQILVDSIYFLNGNNNFTYKTLDWNVKDIIEINGKRQLLVENKNDSNIKKTEMNVKDNLVISAGCIKLNELKVSALIGT
jgi:hypothetical protein